MNQSFHRTVNHSHHDAPRGELNHSFRHSFGRSKGIRARGLLCQGLISNTALVLTVALALVLVLAQGFALNSAHAQTNAITTALPAAPILATNAAAQPAGLSPAYQRYTPPAAKADLSLLASVQTQLLALNTQAVQSNDYLWVKAQRWLDVAQDEYRNNNRGAVPQQALGEAQRLIPLQGQSSSNVIAQQWDTPLLEGAPRIRNDLWQRLDNYRERLVQPQHTEHAAALCGAGAMAYTQVQLTWAAWVNAAYGWRSALPYIAHAEKMLQKADVQFKACEPVKALASPAPAPVPVPSPVAAPVVVAPAPVPVTIVAAIAPPPPPPPPLPQPPQPPIPAPEPMPVKVPIPVPEPVVFAPIVFPPAVVSLAAPPAMAQIALPSRAYFQRNQSRLSLDAQANLQTLAMIIKQYPDLAITVEGYADDTGTLTRNQGLSEQRARVTADYLIAQGISPQRLTAQGVGTIARDTKVSSKRGKNPLHRRAQILMNAPTVHPVHAQMLANQTAVVKTPQASVKSPQLKPVRGKPTPNQSAPN